MYVLPAIRFYNYKINAARKLAGVELYGFAGNFLFHHHLCEMILQDDALHVEARGNIKHIIRRIGEDFNIFLVA